MEQTRGQVGNDARFWLACAALYGVVSFLFWPTLGFSPIALDDYSALSSFAGTAFSRIWAFDHFGHFRPAKNLMFWLLSNHIVSGAVVRTSILVFALAAMALLQLLATRTSRSKFVGIATAGIWALHPTTATPQCWLSAANLTFCLFGILLGLTAQTRTTNDRDAWPAWQTTALSLVGLSIAILSHEMALLSPLLIFSYNRIFNRKTSRGIFWGSLILVVAYLSLRLLAPSTVGSAYRFNSASSWLIARSGARYLFENAALWFWPFGRFGVLLYDDPTQHPVASAIAWVAALMTFALAWRVKHSDQTCVLGMVWAAIFLIPVSNLIPLGNTPIAVHYLYLPGVGFALCIASGGAWLANKWRFTQFRRSKDAVVMFSLFALAGAELWQSRQVVYAWSNQTALYSAAHRNYPDNIEVLANLASAHLQDNEFKEAAIALERAQQLAPHDEIVLLNQFELLWSTERLEAALEHIREHPTLERHLDISIRKGIALLRVQRPIEARAALQKAFQKADLATHAEERFTAGYQLIIALLTTGDGDAAKRLVNDLLTEYPGREELLKAQTLLMNDE